MPHHLPELDELNTRYTALLRSELAELGVHAWYDGSASRSICRGGAFFASYDAFESCFRLFPGSTRYFQASQLSNLISRQQASEYSRMLMAFAGNVLSNYRGRFSEELQKDILNEYASRERNSAETFLFEAQKGLFPDALYCGVPRPCNLSYFKRGEFTASVFKKTEIINQAKYPLLALVSAAELLTLGPGLNLHPSTMRVVFEWLMEGSGIPGHRSAKTESKESSERIILPAFSYGLQGVVVGFFSHLQADRRSEVRSRLCQFGQLLAGRSALIRQQRLIGTFEDFSLARFARALIELTAPVQRLIVSSAGTSVGYRLREDREVWAGHERLSAEEARTLSLDPANEVARLELGGRSITIHLQPLREVWAFDTALGWLSNGMAMAQRAAGHPSRAGLRSLTFSELTVVRRALERQIAEGGRGAHNACKVLYLINTVCEHYADGEAVLTNHRSQLFMEGKLARSDVRGYQVCGSAVTKFTGDVSKVLAGKFIFEPIANKAVRVFWLTSLGTEGSHRSNYTKSLDSGETIE